MFREATATDQIAIPHESSFVGVVQISKTRRKTWEGFLICEGCTLARVGDYLYREDECDPGRITPDASGYVTVQRTPEEVFSPESIASFEGKDICLRHPVDPQNMDFVTPDNWKTFSVGHVQNVRRGEGQLASFMLGDCIIKEPEAIALVEADEITELSASYRLQYVQTGYGTAAQKNIRGNHVALVDQGRCGPECRVGDSAMARSKILDILFRAKDAPDAATLAGLEAELKTVGASDAAPAGSTININVGRAADEESEETKEEKEKRLEKEKAAKDSKARDEAAEGTENRFKHLEDAIAKILKDISGGQETPAAADEGSEETAAGGKTVSTGELGILAPVGTYGNDARAKAKDSILFEDDWAKLASAAALIVPDFTVGSFDAAAMAQPAKFTMDRMCAKRRQVLIAGAKDAKTKEVIEDILGRSFDSAACMTWGCQTVTPLFNGVARAMRNANNASAAGSGVLASAADATVLIGQGNPLMDPAAAKRQQEIDAVWTKQGVKFS